MVVQDDRREQELIERFNLQYVEGRSSTDAKLELDGQTIYFELKSTTTGSVTTVRDFGPDHIKKWQGKHWLIGIYNSDQILQHCLYGSPRDMEPWIKKKEQYIALDFNLARVTPPLITEETMYGLLGKKEVYSLKDAFHIQKRQYSRQDYNSLMDVKTGYSPARMLQIIRERCQYVMERGSTLNNPHIPSAYFKGWEQIAPGDINKLHEKIRVYLQNS